MTADPMVLPEEWAAELTARRARLVEIMDRAEVDVALVFALQGRGQSFRYFTNFTPVLGEMYAVVTRSPGFDCFTDFAWQVEEASGRSDAGDRWAGSFFPLDAVVETIVASKPARLGVCGYPVLPLALYEQLKRAAPQLELVDITPQVIALRRKKSPVEIRLLREAARLTDVGLDCARDVIRVGMSENEVAARVSLAVRSAGGEWAFPPCIIGDPERPAIFRDPSDRPIGRGEPVMVDIGASYEGYQADASRTVMFGEPTREQQKAWDVVRKAYEVSLEHARPGVRCIELEEKGNGVIRDAGYAVKCRIGHGVGLGLSFEWPDLEHETAELEPGMTFCLEPGIFESGLGGLKIEDDLVITETGYELLTLSSQELVIQ